MNSTLYVVARYAAAGVAVCSVVAAGACLLLGAWDKAFMVYVVGAALAAFINPGPQ